MNNEVIDSELEKPSNIFHQEDFEFMSRWMELLEDHIKDKRIVELYIPGTHNSNTDTVKGVLKLFAQNQIWDLDVQMKVGIRFLDIRYGVKNGEFIDQHGPVEGGPFLSNFNEIKRFLQEFKKEFIFIKIQSEEKLNEEQKKDFVDKVYNALGSYMITSEDTWFDLKSVTMQQIWQHQKRVYLIYDTYLTRFDGNEHKGFFNKDGNYHSKWHNTNSTNLIFQSLQTDYNSQQQEFNGHLFGSQFILTTQGVWDTVKKVFTGKIPTIQNMTLRMRRKIYSFLKEHQDKVWNITLFDRIDLDPYLSLLTITMNIREEINVDHIIYKGQLPDDFLAKYNYGNRLICIPDIKELENVVQDQPFIIIHSHKKSYYSYYEKLPGQQTILVYRNPIVERNRLNQMAFAYIKYNNILLEKADNTQQNLDQFKKKYTEEQYKNGIVIKNNELVILNEKS